MPEPRNTRALSVETTSGQVGTSRRAVLRAAWAAPVIALSVAAPRAAASEAVSVPLDVAFTYNDNGRRWITATVTVGNPTAAALTVAVSSSCNLSPRGYSFARGWTYTDGTTLITTLAAGETSNWLTIHYGLDETVAPDRPFTLSIFANATGLQQSSREETGTL